MTTRESWLTSLKQGSFAVEVSKDSIKTIQISEIRKGRIWYQNVYTNVSETRCVAVSDGFSSDKKRHLIPQDSEEDSPYHGVP